MRVEVNGGAADGGDGEGVGGAVVVTLDVAVGEGAAVVAGDLLSDGGGGGGIAALGVAGDEGVLRGVHEGDVGGEAVVEAGGRIRCCVAVLQDGRVDGYGVAVAISFLLGSGVRGKSA